MAASHNLSQLPDSRKSPISRSGVLTIQGFGVRVRMQSGHLEIEDGVGTHRRTLRLARVGHCLRRLVCISEDGFVTLSALKWLSDVGASLVMLDRRGEILFVTGPTAPSDSRLRHAQSLALGNGSALAISKELISAKLLGQENVVRHKLKDSVEAWDPSDSDLSRDTYVNLGSLTPSAFLISDVETLASAGKTMLKPGGVLAVCIDQRELFRLGQMLDELFREQNRIAIINWQRSYTRTNDAANVATTTEYLLVYARELDKAKTGLLPRKQSDGNGTAMPDNDPRPWTDGPATGSNAKAHKSMVYAIQSPFTGELFYPPVGSAWRAGQDQNLEWLKGWGCKYVLRDIDDLTKRAAIIGVAESDAPSDVKAIVLGESLSSASEKAIAIKEQGPWPMFFFLKNGLGRPRLKKFVEHLKPGYVPTTFWASDDFSLPKELGAVSWPHHISGHSEQGVDELTAIVGEGHEFKTVKPLKLFKQVVDLWSPNDGLVLDPFAGSGTTAHAALASNANEGAARRFIMIEQGRPERGDSYARTLTSKRLQRVVSGKWANGNGKPLGGGFEFVTLAKKVDAEALLKLERDEMVDTIIGSHFESRDRRGPSLVRIGKGSLRYLVAKNTDNEGVFLIWSGPGGNTNLTRDVYDTCVQEAKSAKLEPVYHVYARLFVYQTNNVVFYQIPDRILADFGLDLKNEPFADTDD